MWSGPALLLTGSLGELQEVLLRTLPHTKKD